ncbi:hypothetical protein GRJ2_000720700 [Grus japonensis]|uniref:Uncharacterized protein n=1 Tax=Grus japonensis TaxID=30415 RepID=A0ABC9WAK8_GRUJA
MDGYKLLRRDRQGRRGSGVVLEGRGGEGSGVEWSGVEWSGVEWSGVEWSGVEWSGVEWSGVEVEEPLQKEAASTY